MIDINSVIHIFSEWQTTPAETPLSFRFDDVLFKYIKKEPHNVNICFVSVKVLMYLNTQGLCILWYLLPIIHHVKIRQVELRILDLTSVFTP